MCAPDFRRGSAEDEARFGASCWVSEDERFVIAHPRYPARPAGWVNDHLPARPIPHRWEVLPFSAEQKDSSPAEFLRVHGLLGQHFSSRGEARRALQSAC